MDVYDKLAILDCLSSESDSDHAALEEQILYSLTEGVLEIPSSLQSKKKVQFVMSDFPDRVFPERFGLTRHQFNEIHGMIRESIDSYGCNAKQPIGTEEKLGVFLRYLISGDSYRNIARTFRIADRTVANMVKVVSEAIWQNLQPIYLKEPTTPEWKSIATRFEQTWQIPNCLGVISGKHVIIGKPGTSGSFYTNYKHTSSVLLLVTADADYKFTSINIGDMEKFVAGNNSFYSTDLGKKMAKRQLSLPCPRKVPPLSEPLPYVFLGDETCPLAENLMKPYPEKTVRGNKEYAVYNEKLMSARQPVECAFAMIASKFRVLRKSFESRVDTVRDVVRAACVLHNYLRNMETSDVDVDKVEPLPHYQLIPMRGGHGRNSDKAQRIREQFTEYFSSLVAP